MKRSNPRAAKLSNEQVFEMRSLYNTGEWSQGALARRFGVAINTVGGIVRGETRQAVPMPVNGTDKALDELAINKGDSQ